MAENENCFTCVYSYWDPTQIVSALSGGFPIRPSCANHPDSPGRMQPRPDGHICRNYRPRTAAPEGDVRQIPVGQGLFVYVDAADFDWLNRWTWRLHDGYAARHEKKRLILMHRQIMQPPAGMIVDHKNRNKLDNTRANLRNCTHRENARNRDKRRDSASRFTGVSRCKARNGWFARVWVDGRRIWLGAFAEEIEAARAHDRAAVELFGESACLNFPEEWPPQRRQEVHAQHAAANEPVGATHASPVPGKGKSAKTKKSVGANHHSPSAGKRKTGGTKKDGKKAGTKEGDEQSEAQDACRKTTSDEQTVGATHASPSPRKGRHAGAERPKTRRTKKAKQAKGKTNSPRTTGHEPRGTAAKAKRKK